MQKNPKARRPEDRSGVRVGSKLSIVSVFSFRFLVRILRALPMFKGKVRAISALKRVLHLENHHIVETITLRRPTNYKATLDLHSWHEFVAYVTGGYEPDTVEFLVKCYDGKGAFLDLGANIGLLSLPFAILTKSSISDVVKPVYAVEAIKSNHQRLLQNIRHNDLDKVITALGVGVGECEKTVEIQVEGNLKEGMGTGTANIMPEDSDHPSERLPLDITTIDKLIDSGEMENQVSLVKIDLDGYDLKALQGAKTLLSISQPIIYGEFSAHCMNWHGQTHQDVEDFVKEFSYAVFYRTKGTWRFTRSPNHDGDLLLIPNKRVHDFSWCCDLG